MPIPPPQSLDSLELPEDDDPWARVKEAVDGPTTAAHMARTAVRAAVDTTAAAVVGELDEPFMADGAPTTAVDTHAKVVVSAVVEAEAAAEVDQPPPSSDMSRALVGGAPAAMARLEPLIETARGFAAESHAANTRRAYAADWRGWCAWAQKSGLPAVPAVPEVVALYIADLAASGRRVASITRALSGISFFHRERGLEFDRGHIAIRKVLAGARRRLGTASVNRKAAATRDLLVRMVDACDGSSLEGIRDRAVLLVGFATTLRRSRIAAMNIEDVTFRPEGFQVYIPFDKTDQTGKGRTVAVARARGPLCAVEALSTYVEAWEILAGPLFRRETGERLHERDVAVIVQAAAVRAGIEWQRPDGKSKFGAHSLRAGFITTAFKENVPIDAIRRQSGHTSGALFDYSRPEDDFAQNATAGIFDVESSDDGDEK